MPDHSCGTVIALEYYRAHPDRVASLTFGSLCFDVPGWSRSIRKLLTTLPDSLLFRNPVQADLDRMDATYNPEIYTYMWGPSELTITGTLKDYNPIPFLPEIQVPTLFTVGEFDEIDPTIVKELADKVQGSKYFMFAGSSHMTPWDARDENIKVVRDFLNSIDKYRFLTRR